MRRTNSFLFLFVVLLNITFSGGRLASSDELAVYLTIESLVERGELSIDPELVKSGIYGRDGKFYYGAGIAQPVLSIPFYIVGDFATNIAGLAEPLKTLAIKGTLSVFNQFFAGLIAVVVFAFCVKLGYSKRLSLFLALGLLFSTNLFPYFKSFMREPQLLFYLLASAYYLYSFKLEKNSRFVLYAGIFCAIGLLTRLTSVVSIPPLFLYLIAVLLVGRSSESIPWSEILKKSLIFGAPIAVAVGVNAFINYLQFGGPGTMPYAKAEFTTPLFVGIYGLLFSSGKSFFLYAPLTILIFSSLSAFGKTHKAELYLFMGLFIMNLVFFAKFVAWAGDGSWGSRYLIPVLPFVILPIGVLLQSSRIVKRVAIGLAVFGFIIQIGGLSIYLGNYIREIGEYPYTKEFNDPEFLYKSHFIPNYSPIVGHWEMIVRNIPVNLSSERPRFAITNTERRIPLSEETQSNLRYTLDFWFMYAWYAGIRPGLIALMLLPLLILTFFFGYKTLRTIIAPSQA